MSSTSAASGTNNATNREDFGDDVNNKQNISSNFVENVNNEASPATGNPNLNATPNKKGRRGRKKKPIMPKIPKQLGLKCIQEQLAKIKLHPSLKFTVEPKGENLYKWESTIFGPPGTVYEGGVFYLEIHFPTKYPLEPPKIKFRTHIYHCNISSRGVICLNILKDNWSPLMTISSVLLSICFLLRKCNPANPSDERIAFQYLENREKYDKTARLWTKRYATPQ